MVKGYITTNLGENSRPSQSKGKQATTLSVVTPTLKRPEEVRDLLKNLATQTFMPSEVILVDGIPDAESETERIVSQMRVDLPFRVKFIRRGGGTAIQRNIGIDVATGDHIALIDDDVRLEPQFFEEMVNVLMESSNTDVGGVVGFRTNCHFELERSPRWRWYRRLGLLSIFEPGRYDFECGYPINASLQPPFTGVRAVDIMTTACAVWRREVFDSGLRFDEFFRDFGVLEDAHFALRARQTWRLLQCGDAHCVELHSPNGREDRTKIGFKSVVNYYYVFRDISGPLSLLQKFRFWRFQAFEAIRIMSSAFRRMNGSDIADLRGRAQGVWKILTSAF